MKAIAAMSKNRAIGLKNKIPWHIKEDFQWFKEFTIGKILVVGNKTFTSLPPLKNRNFIVLTTCNHAYEDIYDVMNNMAFTYGGVNNVINTDNHHNGELIVIGGAKTYEIFLPDITEFYVTHVNGDYEGDVFMPPFEHLFSNKELIKTFTGEHQVFKYTK